MKFLIILALVLLSMTGITFGQDNAELQQMADEDQNARTSMGSKNWKAIGKDDSLRRTNVSKLIKQGQLKTAKDFYNAGLIFHHGNDSVDYKLAIMYFGKAIAMDSTINRSLYPAAVDRYLKEKGKPQIYGTQFYRDENDRMFFYKIDTSQVSDEERKYYGTPTVSEQRERERRYNLKNIEDVYENSQSIEKTIALIQYEFQKGKSADYDVSENKLINIGFRLKNASKNQEALAIFDVITRLYPSSYNGYALYASTLKKSGKMDEAIAVLQQGHSLNPSNASIKNLLDEYVKTTENHE
ncbi:tetratricopeptide repeat protein [Echinicola strongylocentroti]|uniref:Tetratricopeptide repeat protein n=1 Tax=Echinicola strongylocentroti TaxID=1795355 RepID=A0A2Z4IK96_9BACT|nr:tetratricopeptide repeat protein [Echinicola strongylocentroti]AWW31552.1 tetratricopeptide repeat protein [Echinicola strongylocentroti]